MSLASRLARRFKGIIDQFQGESAQSFVRKAKRSAGVIDLGSAKRAYDAGAVFVDVREVEERRQGHIQHAVHIPRGLLEFQVERESRLRNKDTPVVTYCTAGARAALSAERLEQMGWRNVVTLDAAYGDWERAGYPVERGGYEEEGGE